VDFKLENVLVSLHSLKTMGLGPFGTSAPLFLRNGELLGHSPILKRYPGLPTFNYRYITAGNRHKQNSWFCKEIREDNFGFGGGEFTKTLRKVCTCQKLKFPFLLLEYCKIRESYAVANAFTIRNMYSLFLYMRCNSRKINRPTKNMTKIVTLLHF
jgi:hypothetical protein